MNRINWNSQDYIVVAETLKSNDAMIHKGIFFLKTSKETTDKLLQYLYPINEEAQGANSTALDRSILENHHRDFPSTIIQFLLEHSPADKPLIEVVVFNADIFQGVLRKYLNFIVSHELAHILADHLNPEKIMPYGSEGYLAKELEADQFAIEIDGTNVNAIEFLTRVHQYGTRMQECTDDAFKVSEINRGLEMLQIRINAIQ
jgi:hypothetical protein